MHSIYYVTAIVGSILFIYATCCFFYATLVRRNDVADVAWGVGFIVAAITALLINTDRGTLSILVVVLTVIWGLRLAIHIASRNRGKVEDFRYAQWRKEWGKFFLIRSYIQVFLLQGILAVLVSLPVIFTAGLQQTISISAWLAAGLILWMFGFGFEAIGDYQLRRFLASKPAKGAIMKTGLWKYSRHPNYFGEVTQWWGIWLICASSSLPLTTKLWALVGPLTISTLILFVSGIPLLEKKYANDKHYQDYAKHTSKFFPWNPRK